MSAAAAQAQSDDHGKTCRYFTAVAFKESRGLAQDTFRMRLASDCREALHVLQASAPGTPPHDRAAMYLASMGSYRDVITSMVSERFRARGGAQQNALVVRPVTRSGEILIAKVMGLLDTQTDWRAWRQASVD
ncbi:MAG: hypothetical protein AAF813_00070 [Pseudomonadota bacterium]